MILPSHDLKLVRVALKRNRVVALLGPRQCGKTTLARPFLAANSLNYFDLLMFQRGRRIGVECKPADAPTMTPSMRIALQDLKLDKLYVVYPGDKHYPIERHAEVVPLAELVQAT